MEVKGSGWAGGRLKELGCGGGSVGVWVGKTVTLYENRKTEMSAVRRVWCSERTMRSALRCVRVKCSERELMYVVVGHVRQVRGQDGSRGSYITYFFRCLFPSDS